MLFLFSLSDHVLVSSDCDKAMPFCIGLFRSLKTKALLGTHQSVILHSTISSVHLSRTL